MEAYQWRSTYLKEIQTVYLQIMEDKLQKDLSLRINVLLFCLGDLIKSVSYALYYEGSLNAKGYRAEIKIALSDVYTQLHVIMLLLNLNLQEIWNEIKENGIWTKEKVMRERDLVNVLSLKVYDIVALLYRLMEKNSPLNEEKFSLIVKFQDVYTYLKFFIRRLNFEEREIAMFGVHKLSEDFRTRLKKGRA